MPQTSTPTPRIPADLLPRDGRFGSGPAKIRPEALAALAASGVDVMGTSHRQAPVRSLVGRVREGVSELFSLPEGYEVLLANGGSTFFWDVAVSSLIRQRSSHASFGEFGAKFAAASAAAPHLDDPVVATAESGASCLPAPHPEADVYAWAHNETSTGAMASANRIHGDEVTPDALMVVDATSAAAGLPVDIGETDLYYFAPQKGLGSDGGLWLATASPAAIERIEEITATDRWIPASLALEHVLTNSRANQTLNTPAIATLFLMANQLDWINESGGLEFSAGRSAESARRLYGWADAHELASPMVSDPQTRSAVVATIDFEQSVDAKALAATLRANGILDTEPYRKLGRNQLRIAMYPTVDPDDVTALTECIDWLLNRQS